MFPSTPTVSTKINMNSDFFSSKVFKNRDSIVKNPHDKSFYDNASNSDEESKQNVSRTTSFTGPSGHGNYRQSVVNLGIDHKMLMNATNPLKKADSIPGGKPQLMTKGIETIKEENEGVATPGIVNKSIANISKASTISRPSVTSIGALGSMGI